MPSGPRAGDAGEERRDPRQRDVVSDGEVMHERQRQYKIGGPAIRKRLAFLVRPSRSAARVGEVEQQRKQMPLAPGDDLTVVLLHCRRIDVEGLFYRRRVGAKTTREL